MIRELILYLREKPTLKEAKTFGHLFESISLLSREARCSKTWAIHRDCSKKFIKNNIHQARHFNSVLIFGSGPLHEIPIEELAKTFKRVVLVDIVHLNSTKKSVDHLSNLNFIEHEITEVEAQLHSKKILANKIPQAFLEEDWGLVISANLMSQLSLHLGTYIEKNIKKCFTEDSVKQFLEGVTRNHYLYLKAFNAPVILITDTKTTYYDKLGRPLQIDDTYSFLPLPEALKKWDWDVAPIPEFQQNIGIKMLVSGFVLKNRNSH